MFISPPFMINSFMTDAALCFQGIVSNTLLQENISQDRIRCVALASYSGKNANGSQYGTFTTMYSL
jgi:hypothetical protein